MNNGKTAYQFKPMKGLTFWARLLMAGLTAGMFLWAAGVTVSMLSGPQASPVSLLLIVLGIVLYLPLIFASAIVTLCWVYGASRNAHVLRPGGLHSSPGWAVGWWFVPFASLYKPYETIRDIWVASRGRINDRYPPGPQIIAVWWWMFLISNIVLRFANGDTVGDSLVYAPTPGNWIFVVGLCICAIATLLFFRLVGEINKNQLASNTRAADIF